MWSAALAAVLTGTFAAPAPSHAESPAVAALIKQAQYWRAKGREDLAQQALRRARALDPSVALAAPAKPAAPAPKPAAPVAARPAAAPPAKAAAPASRPAAAYAPTAAVRAGQARVAGYDALQTDNLAAASTQFERALAANRSDPEALGGLGLVRLRQTRFAEAANLLEQASRLGKAQQWASALASARFYAGVEDARRLLQQGRIGDAQVEAEALVRSGFDQPAPALELLAQVYEKQNRFADAAELYRQASQGGKQDEKRLQLRAVRSRALAAAAAGDDMGATREFQNGLVIDQTDPWIRYEFARFMIKRGRMPEAESLLRSLEQLGDADGLYAAALIANDLGRSTEADRLLAMIPEAQRTQPMRTLALGVKVDGAIARAKASGQGGGQLQALATLRQIGAMPSMPAAKKVAVADAMLSLGDAMGAASLAQSAMDQGLTTVDDYAGLVDVLARAGRDDMARAALAQAGQLAGNTPDGQRIYAGMAAKLTVGQAERARSAGRFADAFDMLQGAWTSAPDNTEVLAALARLYQAGRMPGRAAQTWQLFLAREPGNRDALLGLAEAAQSAGDKGLSQQAQQQALRAFPTDYDAFMRMARLEQARGDEGAALRLFKQARALYAGGAGSGALTGGNPFAAMDPAGSGNPFRNMAAPAQPAAVNPFQLGGGTRIQYVPAAGGYAPTGYAPAPYAPNGYTAPADGGYAAAPGYQPAAYPAQGYSAQAYPAPAASPFGQPGYPAAPGGYPAPAAAYPGQDVPAGAGAYPADPVLAELQGEITQLSRDSAPRVDVDTSYRQRSGETGLSQLDEIKGSAKFSTGFLGGRIYVGGEAVMIDAGTPSDSARARFGTNASPEARAIVAKTDARKCDAESDPAACLAQVDSQNASGVALSAGYAGDLVQAEAGTTPIGMGKTKLTFRAAVTPKFGGGVEGKAFVERKPVTDSVLSYAGTLDPVTGERWGQVMRTGGGVGLSYDRDGNGVYGEGRYYRYRGTNVANNDGFEINVGGYMRAHRTAHSSLSVGLNVNYQKYDNSQNTFTWGNGGYFSPQSFLSVGFPINYALDTDKLTVRASLTPGFQSYSEDSSPLYPTDPALQGELDALKAENEDVRSRYDSLSKTGFALNAQASAYYRIAPNTQVGGDISYNTFGSYDELRSMIGVRQSFGSTGQ
ncbi:cellulose synthase [Novosphingobium colocasiae]|uniref:Cellulose synthase n=1 Tax=Novosphingobium colocasiae TaxID=1256513 RepID=A0A918PEB2_9SPHN|nr:cellulose synthase [Novosphingobium colocasiae]